MEGILHTYHPTRHLLLFEHTPRSSSDPASPRTPPNTLLFVGGMYDNFLVPAYTEDLAHLFPRHPRQKWSVMHIQLSSAGQAFGSTDLNRDIEEMAIGIDFIRTHLRPSTGSGLSNIVLMGHSTGCQDVLHYLCSANPTMNPVTNRPSPTVRQAVQGAILQAPVSDREAVLGALDESPSNRSNYEAALEICRSTPPEARRRTYLPTNLTSLFGPVPLSVSRFLSLASPGSPLNPGLDDLFSSDLTEDRLKATFGAIAGNGLLTVPAETNAVSKSSSLLTLISDSDAAVPSYIDKLGLIARWSAAMSSTATTMDDLSTSIPNAVHDVSGDDEKSRKARAELLRRVLQYIGDKVGSIDEQAWSPPCHQYIGDKVGSIDEQAWKRWKEVARESEISSGLNRELSGQDEGVVGLEKEVGDIKL